MLRSRLVGVRVCALASAALGVLLAASCAREAPIEPVLAEVDAFTSDLVKRVEAASDAGAGVDEAQRLLDGRKGELASKIASLKRARAYQQDDAVRKRVMENEIDNVWKVSSLQTKLMSRSMADPAFKERLDRLVNDYQLMFKV